MTGMHAVGGVVLALGVTRLARARGGTYPRELLGVVAFAIVVGAMLPDIDFILTVPIVPFDRELGEAFHRSFTHSFVVFLPIAVAGVSLYRRRSRKLGLFVLGTIAGATLHVLQDFPFWFAEVAALWPIPHLLSGSPRWLSIWGGYQPADTVLSVLVAWEYGSVVLYLVVLGVLAERLGTNHDYRSRLRLWTGLYALAFLLSLALIPFFGLEAHTAIVWAPSPLMWLLVVWITFQMRETIETLGGHGLSNARTRRAQANVPPVPRL